MSDHLDAIHGAADCLRTAASLRADGVLTSSSQALVWDKQAEKLLEPLIDPAARAVLAEFFGGTKYGTPPDGETVAAHVEQNTQEWMQARHYAKTVLLTLAPILFPEDQA